MDFTAVWSQMEDKEVGSVKVGFNERTCLPADVERLLP